jgi:uncharacterized protein (TIGR00369 family)
VSQPSSELDFRNAESLSQCVLEPPFHQLLGFRLGALDASRGYLEIVLPYSERLQRMSNSEQVHGGAIASLIDVAATLAMVAYLNKRVPTIDLRVDYLRPAGKFDLTAKANVRRAGKNVGTVDVEVFSSQAQPIALGRGLFLTR